MKFYIFSLIVIRYQVYPKDPYSKDEKKHWPEGFGQLNSVRCDIYFP